MIQDEHFPIPMAGYLEQIGTGTTDLIDRCVAYGLPTQYIMYAPYGEQRLNQQLFSYIQMSI